MGRTLNRNRKAKSQSSSYSQVNIGVSSCGSNSSNESLPGIISSRFGVWLADLSVHQIFQEEVEEKVRGEQIEQLWSI